MHLVKRKKTTSTTKKKSTQSKRRRKKCSTKRKNSLEMFEPKRHIEWSYIIGHYSYKRKYIYIYIVLCVYIRARWLVYSIVLGILHIYTPCRPDIFVLFGHSCSLLLYTCVCVVCICELLDVCVLFLIFPSFLFLSFRL